MGSAKDFFNNSELAKEKCKKLAEDIEKSLKWEYESVSDYSPGIVTNDETVVRQIFSPIHMDDNNEVKAAAFDDVSNKGLSVNRKNFIDGDEIHKLGEVQIVKHNSLKHNSTRKYIGYVSAKTEKIREVIEGTTRVFAVYDTAMEGYVHHADICMLLHNQDKGQNPPLPKKLAKQARRAKLQRIFSSLSTKEK